MNYKILIAKKFGVYSSKPEDFEQAYEGELNLEDVFIYAGYPTATITTDELNARCLEYLFMTFNINQPTDYRNRSLSVADVVILDEEDVYRCAPMGWQLVEDWGEQVM